MGPVIFAQVIELQAANLHVCVQSWCTRFPLVNTDISASGGELRPSAEPEALLPGAWGILTRSVMPPRECDAGWSSGSAGGEGALPVERVTGHGVGQVVTLKDRGDQLAAAVHAGPVEHRFQVILHGVGGQVQPARD